MSRASTKLWLIEKSPQLDLEIGAGSSLFNEIESLRKSHIYLIKVDKF